MAAPSVIVGLTTLSTADSDTGWENIGGGTPTLESDFFIQGPTVGGACIAARVSGASGNGAFYYESGAGIDLSGDDHAFVWLYCTGFSNLTSIDDATRPGLQVLLVGTANEANYSNWSVSGSENRIGGWRCYPVSGTQSPDFETGTGIGDGSAVIGFGVEANSAGNAAGRNIGADAVRYGIGLSITGGESPGGSVTVAGFSSVTDVNDDNENRYGVFSASGAGAEIQGRLTIGLDDTTTETYFNDSNYVITNVDKNPRSGFGTFATKSDFTGISVVGSATTVFLSNVSFNSVDDYDKGYFSVTKGTNSPALVDLDGCTFQSWGPTNMDSVTDITNTTWINCEAITLNSGTIDQCTVETGVGGTYVFAAGTPNNISNTSFICPVAGGGHAFEVTQSGTYSFVGNQFTDANGDAWGFVDTDNAAVHINGGATGIAVTFNITGGGDGEFTYKLTGVGSTVDFESAVTVNITGLPVVPTGNATEIRILESGSSPPTEIVGVGTENHRTSTYSFSLPIGTNFDVRLLNLDFVPAFVANQTASTDPTNIPVDLKIDRVYDDDTPPSGE